MADTTTELEVLDEIVDVLGGQSGQYETVVPTLQQIRDLLGGGGGGGGYNPALSVGRADALTGADSTAQWATRESTGNGAATVRSVQGAAVVWNQKVINGNFESENYWLGRDSAISVADGVATITPISDGTYRGLMQSTFPQVESVQAGHKFYIGVTCKTSAVTNLMLSCSGTNPSVVANVPAGVWTRCTALWTPSSDTIGRLYALASATLTTSDTLQFKDAIMVNLTQMFGAGNEPTADQFINDYREIVYPYSAPTLKPVQIAGVRSIGRNLIDLKNPYGSGAYNQEVGYQITAETPRATPSGENPCAITVPEAWNSVTFVSAPLEVGKSYKFVLTSATDALRASIYMLDSNHVVTRRIGNYLAVTSITSSPTVAEGEVYFAIYCTSNVATTLTLTNVMLQVATADFNTYEPYMTDSVEWTAQTLRAAGSVRDELTSDELVTRVGVRTYQSGDESDPTVCTDGTTTYYPLATPTTTPISPALPMTYRVQAGGSESIIVPNGEISAPPVLTVAEGESAGEVVMDALACIATPDGPVATANHAVGTYLTMGGKLYKVTSAIAVGETITAGTNVTATTVMDEILALN